MSSIFIKLWVIYISIAFSDYLPLILSQLSVF